MSRADERKLGKPGEDVFEGLITMLEKEISVK